MKKTALVTGITGQDGAFLARLLVDRGYRLIGAHRRSSKLELSRLKALGIGEDELELEPLDLLEPGNVRRLIAKVGPDEVYNLAAQTFVGTSFEQPELTMQTNAVGPLHLLEAIREINPRIRFYQASTSEMFGSSPAPQNERTPFHPRSPYGVAKLAAHWLTVNYREAHGLFACCGILFNHESPLRGPEFVTQKIAQGLARIRNGYQECLFLGNLDARRDWGFAGDYVDGMWRMMQQEKPRDYVLATGQTCSVKGFCGLVAKELDMELEWEGEAQDQRAYWQGQSVIRTNKNYYRPAEIELLCGDATLARAHLAWEPMTTLPTLAAVMAQAAVDGLRASPPI